MTFCFSFNALLCQYRYGWRKWREWTTQNLLIRIGLLKGTKCTESYLMKAVTLKWSINYTECVMLMASFVEQVNIASQSSSAWIQWCKGVWGRMSAWPLLQLPSSLQWRSWVQDSGAWHSPFHLKTSPPLCHPKGKHFGLFSPQWNFWHTTIPLFWCAKKLAAIISYWVSMAAMI